MRNEVVYKRKNKLIAAICAFAMMMTMYFGVSGTLHAAGAYVTASASTVYVGDKITFTVGVNGAAGYITVSGAVSDYAWFDNDSKTYSVTASSTGTITVSISGVVADFDTEQDTPVSGSATVNVIARPDNSGGNPPSNNNGGSGNSGGTSTPNNGGSTQKPSNTSEPSEEEKSSDATLSELTISEGTLNPTFSADTLSYTVVLGKDITSINVDAKANDANASVSGTGEHNLEPGENTIDVICTAEDGTIKTYSIKVSVDETPDIFVEYNGQKLGAVKNLNDVSIPDTFEETKVELEGKETTAYKSNLKELTIIYMINEENEKAWYLYDEATKTITSRYQPIALLGRNVAIVDIPEELQKRDGMIYGEVEVDGNKMMGWTFEDSSFENYVLVYLMDEQGKMQYYLYEKSENIMQLYSNQAALTQDAYKDLNDSLNLRMILLIILAATNVVTILLLLIVMNNKKRKPRKHAPLKEESQKSHEDASSGEEVVPFDAWKYEEEPSQAHPLEPEAEDTQEHELPLPKVPFSDGK